jgi:hypothetical protein
MAQYAITHPFAKGKAINGGATPLAAAGSLTADLDCTSWQSLLILARIGNGATPATALGDLGLTVTPFEDDGTTLFPSGFAGGIPLVPVATPIVAALSAPVAYVAQKFDLLGLDKVRIAVKNNNVAGLQGATAIYELLR